MDQRATSAAPQGQSCQTSEPPGVQAAASELEQICKLNEALEQTLREPHAWCSLEVERQSRLDDAYRLLGNFGARLARIGSSLADADAAGGDTRNIQRELLDAIATNATIQRVIEAIERRQPGGGG